MRKKVLVLGFGVSGKAAALFLLKRGYAVTAVDQKSSEIRLDPEAAHWIEKGLEICGEEVSLEGVSQLILSPGIPQTHPLVQRAFREKIEVIGEIELAFRHIENQSIGVTGSNGKTTTVLLITHLLKQAGKKARALGNVGVGLSSYLLNPDPNEILVIELSSFQLETLKSARLDLAILLNLTPNHLDRHPTMADYAAAKLSIQNCLKPGGKWFISSQVAKEYGSELRKYEVYDNGSTPLGRENIEAAFAIVREFGVAEQVLIQGLASFQMPPHRIEWVADIDGVSYYNDSKSSNVHSVMHAVRLVDAPIVLIAGGTDKGSSYRPWIETFRGKVKRVIAYGAAADKMEKELSADFPFEKRRLFRDAVLAAREGASEKDRVLLSPGCSSYDQFRSYEHRGDTFKQIIKEIERGEWIGKKQF